MKKRCKHLSEAERGKIEAYLKIGWSSRAISNELKRSISTIAEGGTYNGLCLAEVAQRLAEKRYSQAC